MSVAYLNAQMKARLGTTRLYELTTDTSTETTINEDRLNAAVSDAIGEFERITGISEDSDNIRAHTSVLTQGIMFFLEMYKSRESSISSVHARNFYAACNNLAGKRYIPAESNSNLTVDNSDTRPAWESSVLTGKKRSNPQEYNNW